MTYNIEELGLAQEFFSKEGRLRIGGINKDQVAYYTRGYRYIVALDPELSVLQKLDILFKDLSDGMDFVTNKRISKADQYKQLSPVLDYIKNSLTTLFNAYIHGEKLGTFRLDDASYQAHKAYLIELTSTAILSYYCSLANAVDDGTLVNLVHLYNPITITDILDEIRTGYRKFTFSSRAIVRPEASHPLILGAFAYNMAVKYKDVDIIIGLPSGGTELACLVHQAIRYFSGNNPAFLLLPISLHSTKDSYNLKDGFHECFRVLIDTHLGDIESKSILIVDDNSATGASLETVRQLLDSKGIKCKIQCCVAEADLTRITQNLEDAKAKRARKKRKLGKVNVSAEKVFVDSIGILPISKRGYRKHDMKEVIENHVLGQYYYKQFLNSTHVVDKIKNEVIHEAIKESSDKKWLALDPFNSIQSFKETFLSNFYLVDIPYKGHVYPSVEHAYQDHKFKNHKLAKLDDAQYQEILSVFGIYHLIPDSKDFSGVFKNYHYPPGLVKRVSTLVKQWGWEIENLEEFRLPLMIELQLIKYSNPQLSSMLLETDQKILVEGNDWNDTYWGVSGNRGKNFLGRIIMKIREQKQKHLQTSGIPV